MHTDCLACCISSLKATQLELMITAVCTLFEGNYHYGVGALVNSLYTNGFRGVVWAGYRGSLPPWARSLKAGQGYQEFSVSEDCVIRFLKLTTPKFLSNYKPDFMLQLWESYCPNVEALFYFDPDIVNKASWDFYEDWVSRGVALCEDNISNIPANHPWRLAWKEFAEINNYSCTREISRYYNAGFIGLKESQKSLLSVWQELLEKFEAVTSISLTNFYLKPINGKYTQRDHWYFQTDQDFLNATLMLTSDSLSTIGSEGMDLGIGMQGGSTMSHAAGGGSKPWQKQLIRQALGGSPPRLADKLYWQHTQIPIQLYSQSQLFWKKLDLRCGAAIGRFIRRAY